MKQFIFAIVVLGFSVTLFAQSDDATTIRKIYDEALTNGEGYSNLEYLATKIGPRLSGSPGAAAAVEWSRQVMQAYGFDTVWLQPVMVPHWVRGQKEIGKIVNSSKVGSQEVNICALGGSVGVHAIE